MFVTADQIVVHLIGDYVAQSHWMATKKTQSTFAALCHVCMYGVVVLFLHPSVVALIFIIGTHFFIDRFRLARYVVWFKNLLAPEGFRMSWRACSSTGYPPDTPPWLAFWLLILVDNLMHVVCNAVALAYL